MSRRAPREARLASGVRFDCPDGGLLWRDDLPHAEVRPEHCLDCGGTLGLVGLGERIVEGRSASGAGPVGSFGCGGGASFPALAAARA
jgi:hypothetical protein